MRAFDARVASRHTPVQRPFGNEYPLLHAVLGMLSVSTSSCAGPVAMRRGVGDVASAAAHATMKVAVMSSSSRARLVVIGTSR